MKRYKHIIIIAGEPSGDLHGASLIKELKKQDSSLIITGIGGDLMRAEGMKLFFHIKELSAMGVTEVLMQIKNIKKAFELFLEKISYRKSDYRKTAQFIELTKNYQKDFYSEHNSKPDLVILIDYPGFNLKAAAYAKKINIPVLYYITPKVWAWNSSRLKKIKKYVDHAAIIFPFEEAIFKKEKIPATYVGNPLLDYYSQFKSESSQYPPKNFSFIDSPTIIGLLPGSRESEISKLLAIMLKSALIINQSIKHNKTDNSISYDRDVPVICEKKRGFRFLVSVASSVDIDKFNKILEPYNKENMFEVVQGSLTEIFKSCHILVAASGTVTLEAAICGIPMVIIYKTSPLTYSLAKKIVKIPYIGLPNIVAKYLIVPELLQYDATPEKIANEVLSMLNPKRYSYIKKQLFMIPKYLGGAGASERTAKLAIRMLNRNMAVKQ